MTTMTRSQAALLTASIRAFHQTMSQALKGRQSVTWRELAVVISEHHIIAPGGWMGPRSALQMLINDGVLTRTADVHTETYTVSS